MAKLGTYSYPDIRFGDAVEIAARILAKFKGSVTVKGLAWELGMAENSGTLFAKVAALRDFGLVDGRGELKVTGLAQRILHPATSTEAYQARGEAFQRVELLRRLYERFEGEAPDDPALLIGLEEVTKAPRDEIIRRSGLINKHLVDAARALPRSKRGVGESTAADWMQNNQQTLYSSSGTVSARGTDRIKEVQGLSLIAGSARLTAPLTPQFVGVAIELLRALQREMAMAGEAGQDD